MKRPLTQLTMRGQRARLYLVAQKAIRCFDKKGAELTFIRQNEHTTWQVSSRGRQYLLRVHRQPGIDHPALPSYSKLQIEAELTWVEELQKCLSVQVPQLTRNGQKIISIGLNGDRNRYLCSLMSWLPGQNYWDEINEGRAYETGRLVARLHDHGARFRLREPMTRPMWDESRLLDAIAYVNRKMPEQILQNQQLVDLKFFAVQAGRLLQSLGRGPEQFGMIHTDLNPSNLVFQGDIPQPIDFGRCGWGHFLFDIAEALWSIEDANLRKAFFSGYRTIRCPGPLAEQLVDRIMPAVFTYIVAYFAPGYNEWLSGHVSRAIGRARAAEGVLTSDPSRDTVATAR